MLNALEGMNRPITAAMLQPTSRTCGAAGDWQRIQRVACRPCSLSEGIQVCRSDPRWDLLSL
jgi:hypothetical protein